MNTLTRSLTLVATLFLAAGCAQLRNVPLTHSEQGIARPDVQVGDRVVATTRDGARHEFQVTAVEADALRGEHDRVAYTELRRLDVRQPGEAHVSKTMLIVGAVVLGAAAIAAASGGGGSGGY